MAPITPSSRKTSYAPVTPTTAFPVNFPIADNTDLKVTVNGATRTDFTVAATYPDGLSYDAVVNMNTAVTGTVIIYGKRIPRRQNQFQTGAGLSMPDLNAALNTLEIESQEARRDIDQNTADIAQEIIDRGDAIANEATARASADAALGDRITQETADRISADSAEATARLSGDTILQQNLNTEIGIRDSSDRALASLIGQAGPIETAVFDTRVAAAFAVIKSTTAAVHVGGFSFAGDGGAAIYKKVVSEPSHALKFQSADGAWWEIAESMIYVEVAGGGVSRTSDANTLAIQQIGAYLSGLGGGVIRFRGGTYRCKSLTPYNYVEWWGVGKDKTILMLDDLVNANFIMTQGFSSFADDVKRSYSYYATTIARNAAGASAGAYAMVASSSTDFNNAAWYVAINTPAATDADWAPCAPVVGCVSGGMRDLTVDGNAANQVGNFIGCAWYGINTALFECAFQDAATTLHAEVPGAVFSTVVGTNLQWSVRGIECRQFTVCGFLNNAQSDGAFYDVMVYADDTVTPTDCLIHHKSKASGQKWDGLHAWGGASATVGMICDNQTPIFTNTDMERPVIVNQGGFRFFGQVYRANDASRTDGPAFTFASGLASTQIRARVANFRYALKHITSGGNGLDIAIIHTSLDTANAAFRDPSGAGLTYNPNNKMLYLPTYSGGVSIHETPPITTRRLRGRNQSVAYAASLTPNLTNGDFIIVGQLTGNISIASPTGSISVGDEILFYFLQDGTGGRTISWDAVYHGGPTASGAGNLRRVVKFVYTGTVWTLTADTGAWIA